jgi:hypothetical protein
MSAESIVLINAAIARAQDNPITSVDDGTVEAILASTNYEQIVQTALSEAPWSFARKTDACTLLPDAPVDEDFSFALTLPSDVLKLLTIIVNGQPIEYQLDEDGVVLSNTDEDVYAVYTYRAAEDLWPADFKEGIICRLEALYLRADKKPNDANEAEGRAERKFARARFQDSKQKFPKDVKTSPLIDARRLGSAPRRM